MLLCLGGISPLAAQENEEEVKPKPDLYCTDISAPDGIMEGKDNEVKALITNRTKDTNVEGKVKVELVVIQADANDRDSYFVEIDGMGHKTRREALFTGVQAKNPDHVRLLIIIDPEKMVEESNEDNNRRLHKAWVQNPDASPTPSPEE